MKTLNRCLNELDKIIITDVDDRNFILVILNNTRKFVLNTHCEKIRISIKNKTIWTILQFMNYMMQEIISGPVTNQFIDHCKWLRSFILQLETDSILTIDEDDIDFDNCCNSFLNNYCLFEDDDEDDEDDDEDDEDDEDHENDKSKEQKSIQKNELVTKTTLGLVNDRFGEGRPHQEKVNEDCSK